jgi:TatD DNase family protein
VIDTHAHLDACADPADDLVARAREAGIGRIVSVGSGLESCRETLSVATRHDGVFAALGIHPHQAADPDADGLDELRELLADPRAVAVGETGLDH